MPRLPTRTSSQRPTEPNRTGPDRTELEVATAKSPASLTLTRDPLTPTSKRLTAVGRIYRNLSTPRLGVSEGVPRGSGIPQYDDGLLPPPPDGRRRGEGDVRGTRVGTLPPLILAAKAKAWGDDDDDDVLPYAFVAEAVAAASLSTADENDPPRAKDGSGASAGSVLPSIDIFW